MSLLEEIRFKILQAVPGAEVMVQDPQHDGQHLEAIVVSARFEGMPLLRQHQQVMQALRVELATRVHALHLRTLTPAQWAQEQGRPPK